MPDDLFSLWFDELEPGTRFESRGRTITEADVVGFATQTGDFHPQHTDAQWASQSRFGERIAHGLLVVSYAVGMLGLDPERVVALRRVDDVVFKRPVMLGSTIRVSGVVEPGRAIDDGHGLAVFRLRVNADGALAVIAKIETVWKRETAAESEPAPTEPPGPAALYEPIPL